MAVLRRSLKLLTAAALLASAGYSLKQLRELAAVKKDLSSPGASPEEALARLAAADKSGVVRALVEAQLEQARRLGAPPGEAEGSAAPVEAAPQAPSSSGQTLFSAGRRPRGGAGTGVLIDHKTGERLTVKSGSPAVNVLPMRPSPADALPEVFSDSLRSRRNRAVALLLGTVAVAAVLVLRARRSLGA